MRRRLRRWIDRIVGPSLYAYAYNGVHSSHAKRNDLEIMPGCRIDESTRLGAYTYIGFGCHITRARIGRYGSIGNGVQIGQGEHRLDRISTHYRFSREPFEEMTREPCVVGNDVWIGAEAVVLRGTTIGDGAVIGANAVVTNDIPPFAVAVGIPARVIRFRFPPAMIETILASRWWERDPAAAAGILDGLQTLADRAG